MNIINFVRAVEPREKDDSYLPVTLQKELELCNKYNFRSTVLLQYDALISGTYVDIIGRYGKNAEIGLWFEVVQPLVENCGIQWRGRFPWDWHNDVGFLIGYTPDERKILIDKAFERFRQVFGCYPKSVGSWHIDAFSLGYMSRRYKIAASCNCKDQCGTDGYTIWGGYWNGAYYPSKKNMLCPASSPDNQIDVPVFRMLGSDPIHQYDLGLGDPDKGQSVMSLEPVYGNSGSDRNWINWFFDEMFNDKCLALSYAQMGQENSFGWDKISKGLEMQFEILNKRLNNGDIKLMTLGEAGEWFRANYPSTPATAVCADSDSKETDYRTVWYMSSRYRVNTLYRKGEFHIRDIHIFDENFSEKYLDKKAETDTCFFSNVPFMDGFRFSSRDKTAGIYFIKNGKKLDFDGEYSTRAADNTIMLNVGNHLSMIMEEERLTVSCDIPDCFLLFSFNRIDSFDFKIISQKEIRIIFAGFEHTVRLINGRFEKHNDEFVIYPEDSKVIFDFSE